MDHAFSPEIFQRENRTTFLKFQLFPGTFQWNAWERCVPLPSQPEFPEFLSQYGKRPVLHLRGPIRASGGLRTSLVWISKPVVSGIEEEAWFRCWYFSIVFSLFSVAVAVSTHLWTSWSQNCCKNLIPDPVIFLNPGFNLGWINCEYFIKTEKKNVSLFYFLYN